MIYSSLKNFLLIAVLSGVIPVALAQDKPVKKPRTSDQPLMIEGKKERSPIETMELPSVNIEGLAPQTKLSFEDASELLNDPEVLLGIPKTGLALPTQRKLMTQPQ